MAKKKNKHDFWKRMHFKYRVSAINENTLEEIWKLRLSIFWGAFLVALFAFILVTATSVLIIATPIRYYLPGYLDSEVRGEAVKSAIRMDSLQKQVNYQEAYLQNLKGIFSGKVKIDSVKEIAPINIPESAPELQKTAREAEYVKKYGEQEKYNLSVVQTGIDSPTEGIIFIKPFNGVIVEKFDNSRQKFGITLRSASKETVLAALEGTVISTGYSIRWEYTMQIQHKNGFVSIYKHNRALFKKEGDRVRTGEAIGIIDEDKDSELKEFLLYFELWYKGNPVNPQEYITF